MTNIYTSVNFIIALRLLSLLMVTANGDWMVCGTCHCNWISGKKAADCKNTSLDEIPRNLSTDLQIIDFSNNQIPEIRRHEFAEANLQNLHKLYMRNCTLQEISREAFKGLSILIELDLSHNFLRILHPGSFNYLEKIRKLSINYNEIEVLENSLFRDLKYLQLIEFTHNRIKRVEIDTFVHLPVLSTITLDSNRLTTLKKETFQHLENLKSLRLVGNPWNCTCELQEFRDFTINTQLYNVPTNCQEPEQLRGKLWSVIPSDHFACRPKIIQPRAGASVDASHENVTLTCRIRGSPKPDIFWIYNKRPINDKRHHVRNLKDTSNHRDRDHKDMYISELTIVSVRSSDKGTYTCVAANLGGRDEANIQLAVNANRIDGGVIADTSSNLLLIICIVAIVLLTSLIIVILILCRYCRRVRKYTKDTTKVETSLIPSKPDKVQNGSMLEGSVIMEMQKSLLTEVNPVEKPPRRTDIEPADNTDEGHEIKKTLLDDTLYEPYLSLRRKYSNSLNRKVIYAPIYYRTNHDVETHSVALSDTTPRSRTTYVDDGNGTNLPPDLLSFPARVPHSPSLQSSMSNIPDNRLYAKSPLSSPVYQHVVNANGIYGSTPAAFRTLQHPKNRNLALTPSTSRNNSPFIPAPIVYPPVVMKQGYMTIPRKPRVPSWAPSCSTTLSEFQPSSPSVGTTSTEVPEPVYDNLGLRTTAGGNSILNINKATTSQPVRYTMKNRPLPATPNTAGTPVVLTSSNNNNVSNLNTSTNNNTFNNTKIYEPIHELMANSTITSDTEPLYGVAKGSHGVTITSSTSRGDKISKIPPRPPPKPKKKISVTSNGQGGSTSQLFEDEGEHGTEV